MDAKRIAQIITEKGYEAKNLEVTKGSVKKEAIQMGSGNMRPIFYLDQYEEEIEEIVAERIISHFNTIPARDFDTDFLKKEYIMNNLILSIRKPVDDKALKLNYLDLQMIIRVRVAADASFVLNEDLANSIDIDKETIFQEALKQQKYISMSMAEVLEEMLGEQLPGAIDPGMWVVTNEIKTYGASVLFDIDFLEKLSKTLDSDLVILPSSTNEVIVIKNTPDQVLKDFSYMVYEVNKAEVLPEERLSNHAYLFKDHKITW